MNQSTFFNFSNAFDRYTRAGKTLLHPATLTLCPQDFFLENQKTL